MTDKDNNNDSNQQMEKESEYDWQKTLVHTESMHNTRGHTTDRDNIFSTGRMR